MSTLPLNKADLRRQVRERLRAVPAEELAGWSQQIVQRLMARRDLWARPGTVSLFGGLRNEPDLITTLLPWLRTHGWKTALFAMEGVELHAHEVTGDHDLERGPLGVWVPVLSQCRPIPPEELTLILVPGLAFSHSDGARLGRGGGFYDRFLDLPSVNAALVGLCFEAQVLQEIPREPHDACVPALITEQTERSWPPV